MNFVKNWIDFLSQNKYINGRWVFIDGEITDVQCRYCLAATDLGKQYVFVTQKALNQVQIIRKCYLAPAEKQAYLEAKAEELHDSSNKSKIARKQYRNQGQYIEEILQ